MQTGALRIFSTKGIADGVNIGRLPEGIFPPRKKKAFLNRKEIPVIVFVFLLGSFMLFVEFFRQTTKDSLFVTFERKRNDDKKTTTR